MSKIEVFDIKKKKNIRLKPKLAQAMFKMGLISFLDDAGGVVPNPKHEARMAKNIQPESYKNRMLKSEDTAKTGEPDKTANSKKGGLINKMFGGKKEESPADDKTQDPPAENPNESTASENTDSEKKEGDETSVANATGDGDKTE